MLDVLRTAWAAYSFASTLVGGLGLAALLAAYFLATRLRADVRHGLFFVGAVLIGVALYGQAERARGVRAQLAVEHARQIKAAERLAAIEADRARAARKITESLAVQATKDIAEANAANATLKDMLDDAQKRAGAGGACVPRDLSRRLRNL